MTELISTTTTTTNPDDAVTYTPDGRIAGVGSDVNWKLMYESTAEEVERLKAVTTAARLNPAASKSDDRKPMTAERLRKMMGDLAWHKSSTAEKLIGLGQDPATVDVDFLRRTFGKGTDGKLAQDLMKTSPFKYRQAREAARALDVFGN